ncbi:MAG: 30S ribosomal protein S3ae [Candidatus Thermoplasmatota archaeon]
MALARARVAAKKTKDRWKAKQWYKVTAPAAFNNAVLAETLSDEPEKLHQRTIETTLQELTGDMKQMHVKLTFQVKEVSDLNAKTEFVGHQMTSDYVRRLVRRGNSKIPLVLDVETKDGARVRVKPFAVTDRRCQTTQGQQIRRIMSDMLTESAQKNTLGGFLQDILVGGLNDRIYQACRKIHPLRRIEIAKSEIVTATALTDETPIIRMASNEPEPSETPAEGAATDAPVQPTVEDLAAGDEEDDAEE